MDEHIPIMSRRKLLESAGAMAVGIAMATYPTPAVARVWSRHYDTVVKMPATLKVYRNGTGKVYFAPHHSETTCVEAARAVMKKRGGKLVQIINGGRRDIIFRLSGVEYGFDPNRIFTEAGIKATLANKQIRGNYSPETYRAVYEFAEQVLFSLREMRVGPLIALHNNTPGAYSMLSYAPGGKLAGQASDFNVNKEMSPDDFFLVTTRRFFARLKAAGYNVVLQSRAKMVDDGSMSVYCALWGIPYINVEAQSGHLAVQTKMLEALSSI